MCRMPNEPVLRQNRIGTLNKRAGRMPTPLVLAAILAVLMLSSPLHADVTINDGLVSVFCGTSGICDLRGTQLSNGFRIYTWTNNISNASTLINMMTTGSASFPIGNVIAYFDDAVLCQTGPLTCSISDHFTFNPIVLTLVDGASGSSPFMMTETMNISGDIMNITGYGIVTETLRAYPSLPNFLLPTIAFSFVPEPSALVLLPIGVAALLLLRFRSDFRSRSSGRMTGDRVLPRAGLTVPRV